MDLLLTHGYFLGEDPHERRIMKPYPPLGILQISAYLKQKGHSPAVFDSTFSTFASFEETLAAERPATVGIYTNLMTRKNVLKMIRSAKNAGAAVVLGGPEPANYAAEYLARGADVIVYGEGETALEELLPALFRRDPNNLEGIAGIAYMRDDGEVVRAPARPLIPDLDVIPDPDRDAIDMGRYLKTWRQHHGAGSVSLICARGCPYQCTWCSHSVYGHTHRRRSPRRVAEEVERIAARYQPDQLWYADDVFTIHHPWLLEYSGELKRRGLRIPFECISRADRLNESVISQLSEMGCFRLWVGSESGSQRILDAMRRGVEPGQIRSMTRALQRAGIQVGMFVMLGYEGEEIADLEETVQHLKLAAPDVFLTTVAYPIRGTEYQKLVDGKLHASGDWESQTDRDLAVRGRHSPRFYSFATRWMVNSVALDREKRDQRRILRRAKVRAGAAVGRIGMWWTRNEKETGKGSAAGLQTAEHP